MVLHLLSTCFLVLKDFLQRDSKSSRNLEGESDGRHVFPLLKRDNGLPGAAGSAGQFLLRHLVMVKAKPSNLVLYFSHYVPFSSNQ